MNTMEIQKLMKSNTITKDHFMGVFPSDKIPQHFTKRSFFIANLDPSNEPGSHWVAFTIDPNKISEYFDSFGMSIPYEDFKKVLGKQWIRSKVQIQSDDSTTCGQWCMFYIWCKSADKTMSIKDIVDMFKGRNKLENDMLINTFIEKEFNTEQPITDKEFVETTDLIKQCCCTLNAILAQKVE